MFHFDQVSSSISKEFSPFFLGLEKNHVSQKGKIIMLKSLFGKGVGEMSLKRECC